LPESATVKEEPEIDENQANSIELEIGRDRPMRLGVYGRPNVGKSTFVNWLLNENRMITSNVPGTTIDSINSEFEIDGKQYCIVDTAGIRKKSRTQKGAEVLSVVKALDSLQKVDVALFMIDGYIGFTDQDEKVAGELVKTGRPIVILVNKWDLCDVKKEAYAEKLRAEVGFLDFAPILFVSALKQRGNQDLWALLDEILVQRKTVASTGALNRFIQSLEKSQNPKGLKFYFANQISKNPPTIRFFVNDPKKVQFSYARYLKNSLRAQYGWIGSPVRILFKARERSKSHVGR